MCIKMIIIEGKISLLKKKSRPVTSYDVETQSLKQNDKIDQFCASGLSHSFMESC